MGQYTLFVYIYIYIYMCMYIYIYVNMGSETPLVCKGSPRNWSEAPCGLVLRVATRRSRVGSSKMRMSPFSQTVLEPIGTLNGGC